MISDPAIDLSEMMSDRALFDGKSNEFFRMLVENALDIIHIVDEEAIIRYITPSVEQALGYKPEEMIGRHSSEFVHPEDQVRAGEAFRESISRPGSYGPVELRLLHKNGTWRAFEVRGAHPPRHTGRPIVIVNSRDITKRRQAETDLQLSRLYLEQLFKSAPEGIVLLDNRDCVVRANSEFIRIFGFTIDELQDRPINDLIVPEHLRDEGVEITRNVTSGTAVSIETMRRRKDGSLIHVSLLGCPIRMKNGQLGIYGIYRDISDRKRMEWQHTELLDRERVARTKAEAAERRAAFLSEVGTVVDANLDYHATLNNLARLTVPDLADYCLIDELEENGSHVRRVALAHVNPEREGMLYRDVDQSLDDSEERHPVLQVLRTGKPLLVARVSEKVLDSIAHDAEHRAGLQKLGLRSFIIVPLIARGRTLGAMTLAASDSGRVYSARDVAFAEEVARRAALAVDNARLYGQAQQAIEARDRVLAFVSHDLRNPLATILLNITSILDELPEESSTEWLREQLGWIERSTEQMNRLIEDLLDVARIEASRLALERRTLPVAPLLRDVLRMFEPLANENSILLQGVLPPESCTVDADRDRLIQVFSNLIGNALKFTAREGEITVSADARSGTMFFSVADTGCGLAPEHVPHLFDRFWQARRSMRGGGAGLGLAIARGIVEAHGGRIWVESEEGIGTTVYFTLSADCGEADPLSPEAGAVDG